jgi:Gas vesicle synthesis protein GvpL/GvpF
MLHLYGIVESHGRCGGIGLDGQPLVSIPCDDVVAIASEQARPLDSAPSEEALWQHERVLEALLEAGAVLPVRFGVRFADHEELRAAVEPRSAQFAAALAHVRGRVELSVRLLALGAEGPPSAAEDAGPGTRYLLGRLEERRDAERKLDTIRGRLGPLAVAERSQLLPRPGTPASAAFLVERPALERFRKEARELERDLKDVVLVCTGPWPPYNFVDEPVPEPA